MWSECRLFVGWEDGIGGGGLLEASISMLSDPTI